MNGRAIKDSNNKDSNINGSDITDSSIENLTSRLCDTTADVVFFPVRHHSPVAAAMARQLVEEVKPGIVLIEGPADFNEHIHELFLDHQLPISIYSYFQSSVTVPLTGEPLESQHGAFYPFCEYSPEWVALKAAHRQGAEVRFIDLPWSEVAFADAATHRYADAELRKSRYVALLCDRLQVENFDDLWDRLVEAQISLGMEDYLQRVHSLCFNIRLWEEEVRYSDQIREVFMAEKIREAMETADGPIVVITGGFHSSALAARLENLPCPGVEVNDIAPLADATSEDARPIVTNSGIALTTYTYERLDSHRGYDAGMPSPGFYEYAWRQRMSSGGFQHHELLEKLVSSLRDRKQILSTADLIAVETNASALAALRGRAHVWRSDLTDAVTSCLIKDELEYGCESPFVDAVRDVLRGNRRGSLAEGTRVPPLLDDIKLQLESVGVEMTRRTQEVEVDLLDDEQGNTSRLFHGLRILGIAGFSLKRGVDFLGREDLVQLNEVWAVRWSPEFDSTCVEAARFGPTLKTAVASCLSEKVRKLKQRDSVAASTLLVTAAQAGTESISTRLLAHIEKAIASEPEFAKAARTTEHLHFLYAYDETFGTRGLERLGPLLETAFTRSLWLLDSIGCVPNDGKTIAGMKALFETHQRSRTALGVDVNDFTEVLQRIECDSKKAPHVRGGAAGILWSLGETKVDSLFRTLLEFSSPESLGDFLTGLFKLAREVAQRNSKLVRIIDEAVYQFGADDFQAALPSLRLAFTTFTPREKHHMLQTLFGELGIVDVAPLRQVSVDAEIAAEALAIEERLFELIEKYGL